MHKIAVVAAGSALLVSVTAAYADGHYMVVEQARLQDYWTNMPAKVRAETYPDGTRRPASGCAAFAHAIGSGNGVVQPPELQPPAKDTEGSAHSSCAAEAGLKGEPIASR